MKSVSESEQLKPAKGNSINVHKGNTASSHSLQKKRDFSAREVFRSSSASQTDQTARFLNSFSCHVCWFFEFFSQLLGHVAFFYIARAYSDFFIGQVSTDYMEIEGLGRRAKLISLGIILIITGIVIPSLYYSEYYDLLTGKVTSYDLPLLPYGTAVAVLGVIIVVIGLIMKDETRPKLDDDRKKKCSARFVSKSK